MLRFGKVLCNFRGAMIRDNQFRKTDVDMLRSWLASDPKKNWAALLAEGLQPWTIERIVSGKQKGAPRPVTRRAFERATGMPEDVLFPVVANVKETA